MIGLQNVPTEGCNVYYGSYFDNYFNGVRTRYYLYDGTAVASTTSTYNTLPNGSVCSNLSDLVPQPFTQSLITLLLVVGVISVILSAYLVVIKPFIKVKKGQNGL